MSNWLPPGKRRALMGHLLAGRSVRETATLVGCSKVTVSGYRSILAAAELLGEPDLRLPMCECGKSSGHNGWCRYRYQRSERRRAFMRRWHRKEKANVEG